MRSIRSKKTLGSRLIVTVTRRGAASKGFQEEVEGVGGVVGVKLGEGE